MQDSRVIPLKLEGLVRSKFRPLGMGIISPCWKIVGMCPVERMALNMVVRIEDRVSSAKIRCSFERWSGPAYCEEGTGSQ